AMACLGSLEDSDIKRTLPPLSSKESDAVSQLGKLFSPRHGFKKLNKKVKFCKEKAIPCAFNLGVNLHQLVLADDGNPNRISGVINLNRLEIAAKILKDIQNKQKNLKWHNHLLYDVEKAMKITLNDNEI